MSNGIKLKKKSKRMSCKKRYKIEKKIREHNKKQDRADKKKAKRPSKKEKPLEQQIPNKCPFKGELLQEAEARRVAVEAERTRIREQLKDQRATAREKLLNDRRRTNLQDAQPTKKDRRQQAAQVLLQQKKALNDAANAQPKTLESLIAGATIRAEEFEILKEAKEVLEKSDEFKTDKSVARELQSVKTFAGEVRKVLESADVVLEVLDARDPLGSRCTTIEKQIVGAGKRLVLVLNKIDLVPKANLEAWLKYLRKEMPTLAFKASTQEQKTKLGRAGSNLSTVSSKCLGAETVMKLLANYCRNKDIKTSIRVGIIGYPNVGKSSLINSLKRSKSCGVGAMPGVTRQAQEIELDKKIRLLDSPGVVLAAKGDMDPVEIALKNAIRLENVVDPVRPVEAILRRCQKQTMMLQYNIPNYASSAEFLVLIARKLGKIRKGARPDTNAAARKVLSDWNTGKLRYFTQPPEEADQDQSSSSFVSAELKTEMAKEFSIEDIAEDQDLVVQELPSAANSDAILYSTSMDDGGATTPATSGSTTVVIVGKSEDGDDGDDEEYEDVEMEDGDEEAGLSKAEAQLRGNQQRGKDLKKRMKRMQKKKKKTEKLDSSLSKAMSKAGMDMGEKEYSFDKDWSK